MPSVALRTIKIEHSGHFNAAHYLPGYPGKCSEVHGHRWEVTATVEFPIVPRNLVSDEDPDACGLLVDFNDINELWDVYDHPDFGLLNNVITNPTAEVLANLLLEALQDLVSESVAPWELPFTASISLWEGPDSCVEISAYHPSFMSEEAHWLPGQAQGCACECACEEDTHATDVVR